VARSKSVFFDSGHSVEKLIFVCSTLENRWYNDIISDFCDALLSNSKSLKLYPMGYFSYNFHI
jgi:hypothetical protein